MARIRVCDNCGKPLTQRNPHVAKLFLVPTVDNGNGKRVVRKRFNDYTAHMDIGECCAETIVLGKKWQYRRAQPQKAKKSVA